MGPIRAVSGALSRSRGVRARFAALAALLIVLGLTTASAQGAANGTLALPAAADRAADAALVPAGAPARPEGEFDMGVIEDAALARAEALAPEFWEVGALADRLGPDAVSAFEFVRDHVAFDPYAGVLRGAEGTLAARAGNSWDRALLLRALLDKQGHVSRIVLGDLGDDAIAELLSAAAAGAPVPLDEPGAVAAPTLDVVALGTRARRDFALLTGALADAGSLDALGATAAGAAADARAAIRQHAWVQVQQPDGGWLDLDPSLSGSMPGSTLTKATAAADQVPMAFHNQVVVRVLVEMLEDGELSEEVSLEKSLPAADAAHSEIWLYFQPEAAGGGGGGVGALGAAVTGGAGGGGWQPILLVNGDPTIGSAFSLKAGGGGGGGLFGGFGGFGGGGGDGPQLARLRLELVAQAPGGPERVASRVLLDRVDPALRETGSVSASTLTELPESGNPAALESYHQILVSTGSMNPREQAIASAFAVNFAGHYLQDDEAASSYPMQDVLFPMAVGNRELVLASERVIVDGMAADGVRAYVGGARVFVVSLTPFSGVEGGTASIIDLALDDVSIVGAADSATEARQRLWYGTLQGALETRMTLGRSLAVDPGTEVIDSVSLRMGSPLTVLSPTDATDVPAAASELKGALAAGDLAVSVGEPGASGAFWAIDPASGATSSVMEPGLRLGFVGGGNYVNSAGSAIRYIIDPNTLNTIGYEVNGQTFYFGRTPASRCSGGQEYVTLLGCVSIPGALTVGQLGILITAVTAWTVAIIRIYRAPW